MTHLVDCIRKDESMAYCDCIAYIGGPDNGKGERWEIDQAAAVQYVENNPHVLYTSVRGKSAWLIVSHRGNHKYVKTEADNAGENNLLALPSCG